MNTSEYSLTGEWDDLTQRGLDIYGSRLKAVLEPDANGQFVAIHAETGDYAVERFAGDARRALRCRHPDDPLIVMKIGPEPEYSLSSRLMATRERVGK